MAVFLVLGLAIGPSGVGVVDASLQSPILMVVATLSLALVLFTDAITLDLKEVRRHFGLAMRMLGPGTVVSAALIAAAGWALLDLPLAAAAILGAALASTDPVLLRGLLRRKDIPPQARLALRLESGLNDVVLLPIVIVAMTSLAGPGATSWSRLAVNLFVLGPIGGVIVGLVSVAILDQVRRRTGIRRDYESIYSLGVAFAAFAAAESMHGSGFLAAFAAGMTIVWFDVELCDCFVEYGETTAEMLLLFTFVLLGAGPIWEGAARLDGRAVLFVVAALVARPVISYLSLLGTPMDRRARLLIAWFGPRGLSSLLLVLLPVFAGLPGAEALFQVCCLVVLASVALHGGSLMVFAWRTPREARGHHHLPVGERPVLLTYDELDELEGKGETIVIADVRADRSAKGSDLQAAGAVRIDPEDPVAAARHRSLPHDAWIGLYCA
jgi:NhaP-type Na+/H+ or K+/H+ antiporter